MLNQNKSNIFNINAKEYTVEKTAQEFNAQNSTFLVIARILEIIAVIDYLIDIIKSIKNVIRERHIKDGWGTKRGKWKEIKPKQ